MATEEEVLTLISRFMSGGSSGKPVKPTPDQKRKIQEFLSESKASSLIVKPDHKSENGFRLFLSDDYETSQSENGSGSVFVFIKLHDDGPKRGAILSETEAVQVLRSRISESVGSSTGVLNVLSLMRKYVNLPSVMKSMKSDRVELYQRVLEWAEDSLGIENRDEKEPIDLISITKAKERKIQAVIKVCETMFHDLDNYHEGKKHLESLAKEMSAASNRIFRDWIQDSETVSLDKNKTCIQIDDSTQEPIVTFDYKLMKISRDARIMRTFGFNIPPSIQEKEEDVRKYGSVARELREIVNFYCTVGDQILLSQKPMLIESARRFTSLLESKERISWTKDPSKLKLWLEELRQFSKIFSNQNRFLRQRHQTILSILIPLFDRPVSKWRPAMNEIRTLIHEVDTKFNHSLSWKMHWDHQLYKVVEYQFNDALLSADSWLGSGSEPSSAASHHLQSSTSDVFRLDLCLIAGQIAFRPSLEEVRSMIFNRIRKFLSMPSSFVGLVEVSEDDSIFNAIFTRSFQSFPILYSKANDIMRELQNVSKRFKEWTSLYQILQTYGNNSSGFSTFLKLDSVNDYKRNLLLLKTRAQMFNRDFFENEYSVSSANIIINLIPIKSSVEWILSETDKLIINTLKDRTEHDSRELKREVSELYERITKAPEKISELVTLQDLMKKDLPQMMTVFDARYKEIISRSEFLKKWSAKSSAQTTDLQNLFEELQSMFDSRQSLLDSFFESLKAKSESKLLSVTESINIIKSRWKDLKVEERDTREVIAEFMSEIETLKPDFKEALISCEYFDQPKPKSLTVFESFIEDIQEIDSKINIISDFESGISHFIEMEWIVSRNKLSIIEHYINKWQEDHPNCGSVIESRISEWKEILPILKLCRGECFAKTHWQEFLSLLDLSSSISFESLTLSHLVSRKDLLKEMKQVLRDLNQKAVGETSVRETFNELDEFASSSRLTLFEYSTADSQVIKLIKDWRVILNQISESILTLQSLKSSDFFSNEFAERSAQWESRLTSLDTIINLLNTVQRKWTYLEPIYAKNNKKSGVFGDYTFSNGSKEFLDIMRSISTDPHVIRLLRIPNIESKLREVDLILIGCQKKLYSFMEESRNRFPRFYFLADDDLLLVLAGKVDITEAGLLKKLFNNNLVKLNLVSKIIISVESPEGEVLMLSNKVSTDTESVESWLLQLETEIKMTLKKSLHQLMSRIQTSKTGFSVLSVIFGPSTNGSLTTSHGIFREIPSQILSLFLWITFTSKAENSIKTANLTDLKKDLSSELTSLTNIKMSHHDADESDPVKTSSDDAIRSRQEATVAKIKIKSMILDVIHFLAVVDDLMSASGDNSGNMAMMIDDPDEGYESMMTSVPKSTEDWRWQKHMRYYYSPKSGPKDSELNISMGLASSKYSFEYLGCYGSAKLVHTPLTDKCYLTCMTGTYGMTCGHFFIQFNNSAVHGTRGQSLWSSGNGKDRISQSFGPAAGPTGPCFQL